MMRAWRVWERFWRFLASLMLALASYLAFAKYVKLQEPLLIYIAVLLFAFAWIMLFLAVIQ